MCYVQFGILYLISIYYHALHLCYDDLYYAYLNDVKRNVNFFTQDSLKEISINMIVYLNIIMNFLDIYYIIEHSSLMLHAFAYYWMHYDCFEMNFVLFPRLKSDIIIIKIINIHIFVWRRFDLLNISLLLFLATFSLHICTFFSISLQCFLAIQLQLPFVFLFSLIFLQAGSRQEPHWVINAKPTYCRSLRTSV